MSRQLGSDRDSPTPVTALAQQLLMAYRDIDWPAAKAMALTHAG